MKKELALVLGVFAIAFTFGYNADASSLIESFAQLQGSILSQPLIYIFLRILLQNALICALMFFGGYLLSIPTFFLLITNGFSLGILFHYFATQSSTLSVIVRLIPHGLFELPAFFLSATYGLIITTKVIQKKKASPKLFLPILILLIIAAFVETLLIFLSK